MSEDNELRPARLPDLTDVPLADLLNLDHPRLKATQEKVVEQISKTVVVAGFGSAI